ncbi:dimethylmenaquinone methyltransferase [Burkholderia cepacia]|nr:dimethylmenaquinone methyltransferase [Burkholderia cepacia]
MNPASRTVNPVTRPLDPSLAQQLRDVSLPTLGHFLETGFANPVLRALVPGVKLVGRAVTLQLRSPDAIAVNRALARLTTGDVLVIDMHGDHAHACVGAVTATAAQCAGAAGIVVDGVATDLHELRQIGLPVFARGTSALTTKRLDDGASTFGEPVRCGGVTVAPGSIVVADDNGVLFADAATLAAVVEAALASDRAEPALLARLRAGEPVSDVLSVAAQREHSPR